MDKKNMSLVERAKLQMSSSLLRLMDEKLYSTESDDVEMNKEKFLQYHAAYSKVSNNWPTKPIDYIVKFIKKRLITVSKPAYKWRFADIGCGKEPLLKMKLPPIAKVQSFDLVSAHDDIIESNMENLPVKDDTFNCIVYSLSLMAKDLGKILLEAKRILKLNGSLLIVEVTSRFDGKEKKFIQRMERIGFKLMSTKQVPPNGYFTFFHFTKNDSELIYSKSSTNIQLKGCLYKTR